MTCSIEDCDRPVSCRGWCEMHYYRWRRHGDTSTVLPRTAPTDPRARFWSKVEKAGPDECWLYRGTILNTGYGQISFGRRHRESAHRFAYADLVGPIPEGLTIDHLCFVRACVNPAHLEPVTQFENTRRMHERQKELRNA